MKYPVSSIWLDDFFDQERYLCDLRASIERGVHQFHRHHRGLQLNVDRSYGNEDGGSDRITLFFRADDIGVPSRNFSRLTSLFSQNTIPLGLAVVPTWMTQSRWDHFQSIPEIHGKKRLWCWHHHGWRHMNHEPKGKKQEFGPSRSEHEVMKDLKRGKERLKTILGKQFIPIFTPPWNRCSEGCMRILNNLGYKGISRFDNAKPAAPDGLKDISVNVDLHTLKAPDPASEWTLLMRQLEGAVGSGWCGIMIHHQRMNDNAFLFLEWLFQELNGQDIEIDSMSSLADQV